MTVVARVVFFHIFNNYLVKFEYFEILNFLLNRKIAQIKNFVSLLAFVAEILTLIDCDKIENQLNFGFF